jgi:hypothetical protein
MQTQSGNPEYPANRACSQLYALSIWTFEDATTTVPIETGFLENLIQTATAKIASADEKFAAIIAKYSTAVAAAQAVLDNQSHTQTAIDTQIPILQRAEYLYDVTAFDLPFMPSTAPDDPDVKWYLLNNLNKLRIMETPPT